MARLSVAWMHHDRPIPGHHSRLGITAVSLSVAGALLADPFELRTANAADTTVSDIPARYYKVYTTAVKRCDGLKWYQVAAVGKVMTNHGRTVADGVKSGTGSSGRAGPMMFSIKGSMGDQWSTVAIDGDKSGNKSVYSGWDSGVGLADYLCNNSGSTTAGKLGSVVAGLRAFYGTGASTDAWVQKVSAKSIEYRDWKAAPTASIQSLAIAAARTQKGTMYKFGGDPSSWTLKSAQANDCVNSKGKPSGCRFDCSSLLEWAYARQGVKIATWSQGQYDDGKRIKVSSAKPGDLVFFSTNGRQSGIHHVAMVTGNNKIIEAPRTGLPVRETSYESRGELMPYAVRISR